MTVITIFSNETVSTFSIQMLNYINCLGQGLASLSPPPPRLTFSETAKFLLVIGCIEAEIDN